MLRLTRWTTANGALIAPDATVAQVDLDESGSSDRADLTVLGDVRHTAGCSSPSSTAAARVPRGGRLTDELRAEIAGRRWRDEPFEDASSDRFIDPAR